MNVSQTFDLALQYHQAGKLHQAELLYRQILEVDPRHVDALHLFGVIAHQVGRHDLAADYIQQAIRLRPEFPEAYNSLGITLTAKGKLVEALASFKQALDLMPDYADAHFNLGKALQDQGKFDEAIVKFRQALHLQPEFAEAHYNLGTALAAQGRLAEAVASYQQALRLKPNLAGAYNNLGNALKNQGKLEEAITNFQQALRLQPDFAMAYNNLGTALATQGKSAEAVASYQQALRLQPNFAEAYNNLGMALAAQERSEDAVANYQQALRLQPDFAAAYNNLGNALRDQGKLDEAITAYRTALTLDPDGAHIHSNLVYVLLFHPHYNAAAIQQECQRWNVQHAEPLAKFRQPHANSADPERRLRIGYVSPDFRTHAVSKFLLPLLSNHDHRQVEIFCYAEVTRPDDMTERLHALADVWRTTVGLGDETIAGMVREDRIDILVDLALHTGNNRLLVFARKPAPVQVSWLGYPGTTGLSTIDYRLTDAYLDPPGLDDAYYAEESIRLPDTFWCYDPNTTQPVVNKLPAAQNGFLTFGCLNHFCKVNDVSLSLFARVLQAVPHSRLLLRTPRGQACDRVLAKFQQEGIAAARVEIVYKQPSILEYLQKHHAIDVCLDPLPYNGHTTSLDAFWMGVPTITLVGKTVVGRVGWSLLCNLGLQDLAAQTPDEYVAVAVRFARDLPRLQELRATMRVQMRASPLMDAKRFAHHMEDAYRHMWRKWCQKSEIRGQRLVVQTPDF